MVDSKDTGLGRLGIIAGLVAAVTMLAVMLVLRVALQIPSLPELLSEGLTLVLPLPLFGLLLGALEARAKFVAVVGLVLGHVVLGALIGYLYARLWGPASRRPTGAPDWRNPWMGGLVVSGGLWVLALLLVMPASGVGLLGLASRTGTVPLLLSTLAASLAYGLSLVAFTQGLLASQAAVPQEIPALDRERRVLVMKLFAVPIALLAAGGLWQLFTGEGRGGIEEMGTAVAKDRPKGVLPDEITPNNIFYQVSKNLRDPVVDLKEWSLDLRAQGGRKLSLTYNDLKSLPAVEQVNTLICISNEVGGDLISNARWTGVRLRDLLARLGTVSGVDVVLKAWDGYSDSIPFDKAMEEGTVLAYMMNGEPLPPGHGFPARLLVPGIYGMKNVKWVTAIELVDQDFQGYWQNRGWSDVATIKTMSRLDVPGKGSTLPLGPVDLGGVAFSGDRGISKVEVSADAGKSWTEMKVKQALSPYAWSLWTGQWQPSGPGNYVVYVRASDGQGQVQEKTETEPLPDGASGYDTLSLTLR
ncbi:MAG TPA: molybdopterin-dependent oxidoreductase [Dehalococcoidia bacterium]|nr:molybdopterin-dependent oxidoreductase [Dehalococcoidia bacterium]